MHWVPQNSSYSNKKCHFFFDCDQLLNTDAWAKEIMHNCTACLVGALSILLVNNIANFSTRATFRSMISNQKAAFIPATQ